MANTNDNTNYSTNDQPTMDSQLGIGGFVRRVADEVRNSPSPKSLSITGYWGSGKTSALAQLYKALTNQQPPGIGSKQPPTPNNTDITGIWFEAWRYQNEPVPVIALLHCIKNHFSTTAGFIDSAGKLTKMAVFGALSVFDGVIKSATGMSGVGKIKDIGEKYEKDNLLSRLATDQINDALEKAINVILNDGEQAADGSNKKLVIFIDDLDRCEPKAAEKLLEGIKLYLNIPNCTVVLAIDQKQIEGVLSKKAKDELDLEDQGFYGVEYLEKLCQDTHRLPIPNQQQRNAFVLAQIQQLVADTVNLDELEIVFERFDCLPANPRRLKMLANRMASFYRLTLVEKQSLLNDNFADSESVYDLAVLVLSVFSVSYPLIYERLEISEKFINDLIAYCDPEGSSGGYDQQAFAGFTKPSTNTSGSTRHPSALEVFRLVNVFQEAKSDLDLIAFGKLLHSLIAAYNQ